MYLLLLFRPVEEQEAELRVGTREAGVKEQRQSLPVHQPSTEQFGEGLVKTTECSDTDRLALTRFNKI